MITIAQRKSNGDGTVYYHKGRKQWVGQLSIATMNGKLRRKSFYGNKKTDVAKKMSEFKKQNIVQNVKYSKHTISTWLLVWMKSKQIEIKELSYERYRSLIENHLLSEEFSNMELNKLNPMDFKIFYQNLKDQGKSINTIYQIQSILHTAMNDAIKQKILAENPCSGISIKRKPKENSIKAFTLDEQIIFTNYLMESKKESLKNLLLLTLGIGTRLGETIALTKGDINTKYRFVKVDKQVSTIKDKTGKRLCKITPPKSEAGIRKIDYPSALDEVVEEILQCKSDLLFTNTRGGFMDNKLPNRHTQAICKKLNLPILTYHNLRHSYATRLFEKNVPMDTISQLMGHSDRSITSDVYTHVMPYMTVSAVNTLNELFEKQQ